MTPPEGASLGVRISLCRDGFESRWANCVTVFQRVLFEKRKDVNSGNLGSYCEGKQRGAFALSTAINLFIYVQTHIKGNCFFEVFSSPQFFKSWPFPQQILSTNICSYLGLRCVPVVYTKKYLCKNRWRCFTDSFLSPMRQLLPQRKCV